MIKSMTAYAFVEQTENELNVSVEIRTYNSRYLDVILRLPMGYAAFEEKIKTLVAGSINRGRVDLKLTVRDDKSDVCDYEIDSVRAKAYLTACEQLKSELALKADALPVEHLLSVPGVIQPTEVQSDIESHWDLISRAVDAALRQVDQMRQKEGAFLKKDFVQRLTQVEQKLDAIENSVQDLPEKYRQKLQARVEALTKGMVELDPSRIAQEAGMLADRSDISEEIVRARSHISQFRNIMDGDEPAGRKLNFLLQEFNREFNTMGAKVGQATAAHMIVDVKSEIEKLREQIQNIE
ncbi:MAG: YicC family protein [Desulfobacteraceae bacterium]